VVYLLLPIRAAISISDEMKEQGKNRTGGDSLKKMIYFVN
jgi:hypothetical protein